MKNIDFIIKKASQELGIPEDKAKVVVMAYWKSVYQKLLAGQNTALTIRHIGTFAISRYKLNISILKRIAKIKRVRKAIRVTEEMREKMLDIEMTRLKQCLKHRNEIAIQYAKNFGNI